VSAGIFNLHNHTPFSDGAYTIDELAQAHLNLDGAKVAGIGISDHLFRTPSSREVKDTRDFHRLFAAEARNYIESVHAARRRWEGQLEIACGCEINWPLNRPFMDEIRPLLTGVDYVLFEFVDWAGLTQLANQARRWPCPIGLAHTRVEDQFPNTSLEQVVRTMANARIFYEVNAKFLPLSTRDPWFRTLPKHRVFVTLGTDTHDDIESIELLPELNEFVQKVGLGEKILSLKSAAPTRAAANA